jgi:hypothetical protein
LAEVLREIVVGGEHRDGLRAHGLAGLEEAVGPARGVVARARLLNHMGRAATFAFTWNVEDCPAAAGRAASPSA